MKLLLDTCALIWWTLDQAKLSSSLIKNLNESESFVSSISIWEIGIKIKNKKLAIGMPLPTYIQKLKEISMLEIVPVSETIWLKNLELPWDHKDPADRTIVATAALFECHIVTTDETIRRFYPKTFF